MDPRSAHSWMTSDCGKGRKPVSAASGPADSARLRACHHPGASLHRGARALRHVQHADHAASNGARNSADPTPIWAVRRCRGRSGPTCVRDTTAGRRHVLRACRRSRGGRVGLGPIGMVSDLGGGLLTPWRSHGCAPVAGPRFGPDVARSAGRPRPDGGLCQRDGGDRRAQSFRGPHVSD